MKYFSPLALFYILECGFCLHGAVTRSCCSDQKEAADPSAERDLWLIQGNPRAKVKGQAIGIGGTNVVTRRNQKASDSLDGNGTLLLRDLLPVYRTGNESPAGHSTRGVSDLHLPTLLIPPLKS
ncbi:hypothetical protein Z043_111679 [Scleropages formosus]|uniref:Uncharacterized protein n=1 Tax=Scleropages formosus TaxID=113540 RepID=A0A0P7U5X5_SCLFO|nr:hypothetical protein Z043_111679 [Scleropages formosus]